MIKPVREDEIKLDPESLTKKLKTIGLNSGADLVGFVSAQKLEEGSPKGHRPSNHLPSAKSVIVLACGRWLNEDREYYYQWGPNFVLSFIKLKDDLIMSRKRVVGVLEKVENLLKKEGFKTAMEYCGWTGVLSFKMAAYLAGLGVFGKGNFLIHPKHGPLNVLGCIVTDAPLKYGTPLNLDLCGECVECIKACKYGALKKQGKSFTWIGRKCRVYDRIMNPVTERWTYGPCNSKCVNVCPIGKSDE